MALTAYLYYDSAAAILLLLPAGGWHFKNWEKECLRKKRREFQVQFQEAIQSVSASLNVGYSIENSLKEAKKDLDILYSADAAIQREFKIMLRQTYLHIPVEQIMQEWAGRVNQEDVNNFAAVFVTARKSGGDMIEIIRNSVAQIREKLEVKQEIETMLAAKKYEFKVMCTVPFGIIAYMKLSFPEFMDILYGNILGIGVMSVCLAIYLTAYYIGERIVDIEV